MSTSRSRRHRATLPPWLAAIPRGQLAQVNGKPVRVTFQLTAAQRAGLTRVLDTAKWQQAQLSEGDVCRVALDQLLAAFERAQVDPEPAPVQPAEPQQ